MKFAVSNSGRWEEFEKYKPVLEKYNLQITKVKDPYDDEEGEIYHIEINSLEELMQLKQDLQKRLILMDWYMDCIYEDHDELTIEIYDGYRE